MNQMLHISFGICLFVFSEGLRLPTSSSTSENEEMHLQDLTKAPKIANVYVINLKARRDRCLCMSSQLINSPFPVFRIEAATPDTQFDLCPTLNNLKTGIGHQGYEKNRNTGAQTGLFCSNYLAWQHATTQSEDEKPAFTIIMEDDLILHDETKFWHELSSFLGSDCEGDQWDRVVVDTFAGSGKSKQYSCKHQNGEKHTISDATGAGTVLQIFRTSALHKYLGQTNPFITDKWQDQDVTNGTLRVWKPNIANQAGRVRQEELAPYCSKTISKSDIVAKMQVSDGVAKALPFEC